MGAEAPEHALIPTPKEISPYRLFQEEFRDEPWKLLVCCILVNLASAKSARPVWQNLFSAYPTPQHLLLSGGEAVRRDLEQRLRPLGFQKRRAERIVRMTEDFLRWDGRDPTELYGIGKYGADSYSMFVKGYLVLDAQDKELLNYVRWSYRHLGYDADRVRQVDRQDPERAPQEGPAAEEETRRRT